VGDLSATLIDEINPLANLVRIPSKKVALMAKMGGETTTYGRSVPAMLTSQNISGVPSWMLVLLQRIMQSKRGGKRSTRYGPIWRYSSTGEYLLSRIVVNIKHIITSSKDALSGDLQRL